MKKTKISGIIGIALILSAVLLIALTAFFGVFDANRKVNEFVDTLPGNEENIETPLPDEPETTLPDTPDTPVTPDVTPSEPPTVAEAAKAISQRLPSTVSNAGTYGFPNNCWTSYNKDSDGNDCDKCNPSYGNSASNLQGSGISATYTYVTFKNTHDRWIGSQDRYATFKGSFTVNLSGKALNYARAGLLNCTFGLEQKWSGGGLNQSYTFTVGSKSVSTNSSGEPVSLNTSSIDVAAVSSSSSSFTVSFSATMGAKKNGNVSIGYDFWIQISFDKDTTKPNAYIYASNSDGFSTVDPGSNYFRATDNAAGIKSVKCTFTPFGSSAKTSTKTINSDSLNAYYTIKYFFPSESNYFGTYTFSVTDNDGNTSSNATIKYYKANVSFNADTGGSISNASAASNLAVGATYNISATVTANEGYYFIGWNASGDSKPSDLGVGSYSNGKWTNSSRTVPAPTAAVTGNITYTAKFRKISDISWFSYTANNSFVYAYNTSCTNLNSYLNETGDFVGNAFTVSLTYTGTTAGKNNYNSSDQPKYAGTYRAVITVSKDSIDFAVIEGTEFTITAKPVYLVPNLSSSSKDYDGSTDIPIGSWAIYDDAALKTAVNSDGLTVPGTTGVNIRLSSKNAGEQNIVSLVNSEKVKISHTNKDILNSYSATVVTGRAKFENNTITTYTINELTVKITNMVIREKTTATASKVYTGKVYDRTTALGANVVAYVYSSSDGAAEFNSLTQYDAGTIGIGIKFDTNDLTKVPDGENLSVQLVLNQSSVPGTDNTVYFTAPSFTGSAVGTNLKVGLPTTIYNTSGNYSMSSTAEQVGGLAITKKPVSVSFSLNTTLTYDGSATVSGNELTATLNGIIDGDNVGVTGYTGTLNDMNAGDGRTITVSGYTLSDTAANNYSISNTSFTISDVTVAARAVSVSAAYANPSKVYDGTVNAEKDKVSLSYSGHVKGEDENNEGKKNNGVGKIITGFSVQYSSANAGDVNIVITVTPHSNYTISNTQYSVAATITAKPLSASGIALALDNTSFVYSGDPYTPSLDTHTDVLGDGSEYTLVSGKDYSVSISSETAVGNYSAVVEGINNYSGTVYLDYSVTAGDYTVSLDKAATITLPYGKALDGFGSYFIGNAVENQHNNDVPGSWALDANGITYNKDGLDIYAAGNHTIYAVFTVDDSVKDNFKYASKNIAVTLTVTKAYVTIAVDDMEYYYAGVYDFNFGSEYVVDRVTGLGSWGDHYTVSGVLSGDEENLYGLTFGFAKSGGFAPENETLNDARTYVGAITLTAYSSPNYIVTVVPGDVTIKPLPVTLTPVSGQSKYYGAADPVLQYTLSTLELTLPGYTLNGNGEIVGSLSRDSGESAGYYNFVESGLSSDNYALTVSINALISFRIIPLPITIVPGNTEIYFGATFVSPSVDNGFSFTATADNSVGSDVVQSGNALVSELAGTNTLTISFRTSAVQGSAAGEYSVTTDKCSAEDENGINNFTFDLDAAGVYTIKALPVKITANAVGKQFADVDPGTAYYTATVLNGIETDKSFNLTTALKGNLAREPGENVGTYAWNIGTLTEEANPSFEIDYDLSSAKFTVYRRNIALQASKINGIVYGESIPAILGEKGAGDGINSGEWSLAPGNTYYGTGFNTALYPDLDFTIVGGLKIVLTASDFDSNGFLSTKRDEESGNAIAYDLAADSVLAEYLSADSDKNYFVTGITGLSEAFFVEPVKAVVYIDPTKSATFTFGTTTAEINNALAGMYLIKDNRSDSLPLDPVEFTGLPVLATENGVTYPTVGKYIMDVSNIKHINGGYDVELLPDQYITVTAKTLTVTVTGGNTHEYGAATDSVIEYTLTGEVDGYPVTGAALSRDGASGTFSEKMNAGSYVITYGTLPNGDFPNYNFVFGATYYYTITPRPITVVPIATSSVYGDPEKVISYETYYNYGTENQSAGLLNSDRLGGSLQRANSHISDAGVYKIERGTLNLAGVNGYNPNYKVTVESGVYTIERKAITVYADTASSHAFGLTFYDPDRLDITISSAGNFDVGLLNGSADIEISSEQYSAANNVMLPGSYPIVQGTLTNENNPNFDITFVPRTTYYVVAKASVTYYVNSVEFNYGQFEYDGKDLLEIPAFASAVYVGGLVQSGKDNEYFGDFTGDISLYLQNADTGRLNAGNYGYSYEYLGTAYLPGQSFETDYYVVNISGANNALNVNAAPVTVSVQLDGETLSENGNNVYSYNAAERVISLTYNGVIDGDDFAAQETVTVAFENAAAYAVTNGISAVGKYVVSVYVITDERNYYISGKGASSFNTLDINVEIAKAELSVSADVLPETSFEKVYGSADPDFTAAVPGVGGESVTIAFVREYGESVGEYPFVSVNVGTEFAENYNAVLINSEKAFAVTPAKISADPNVLLADRLTKTYGDADPAFAAYADGVNGESVAVTFVRTSGENAGEYQIASVITENGNYTVTVTAAATFTVTPKAATVTADNKSAIYDGNDFSKTYSGLAYTVDGFINNDAPVGALAIASPAVNAGEYTIYAETAFENANYEITFVPGTFTIERRQITVTSSPMSGVEFLFDPELEYFYAADSFTYTVENIVDGEVLNGSLGDLRMQAGYGIPIPQGTLTDENNPNYAITYIAGTIYVDKITLLITPAAASSVYGEADTVIDYSVVRADGKALPENFRLNGALSYAKISRTAFADVGNYVVTLGNLSEENPDYIIEFAEGAENVGYTVVQRPVTLTISDVEAVYGEALKELTMVIGGMGLATGETDFAVTLQKSDPDNRDVGEYVIYLADGYDTDNPNYAITVNEGKYTIVPCPITVHLLDQAADWNKDGIYTVDQKAYDVIEGDVVSGDNLGIVISSEIGKQKRKYPITAVSTNRNYAVTFNDDATFEVRKFRADITVPSLTLEFIYSGEAFSIAATLNSGAEIVYTWEFGGTIYHDNAFVEVGRYVVTLSAGETEDYYAPENVTVNLTIKRETLVTEESGIEIVVDSESGFNPEVELEVEKMDQNDKDLNEVISGNESIVRAFNITTSDESSDETTTITVRVPEALKDLETVKVLVKQDGVYSVRMLNVDNGYVTIESAESVSAFAFVKEEASVNYLMIILIGGAALIIIVGTVMFMLKKRG